MKNTLFFLTAMVIGIVEVMAQWSDDPMINTAITMAPGEDVIPKIASAESGISYVSWFALTGGNYNVRLQKLDVLGNKLWAEDGLLISDHPSMTWLTDWDMTVDQDEHAILVFQDIRTGYNDIFAYRISPEGEFVWGPDGLQLSSGEAFDAAPKVTVTNAGNAVFAWQADYDLIRQKISPEGTLLWGENGIIMTGAVTYSWPQLMPVGDDDVIMKYFEDSGPAWAPTRHVYAQRLDAAGAGVWTQPAVVSDAGGISAWTQIFPFINDGNDGFFIAWHDDRDNNTLANMWVQHIGDDGSVIFPADGSEVSTQGARNHFYAHLALPDGSEEVFAFWNEMDPDQNLRGIYGQKFSSAGERLWSDNAKTFIEISSQNVYPLAARSAGEDMVVFYEDYFDAMDGKIKAMRIDADGSYIWDPTMIDMCSVQSSKVHAEVGELSNGQWIAVWEDDRNGNPDVYGQNIQPDGSLGPVPQGSVTVTPDTLWFTVENFDPKPLTIKNYYSENITVNTMDTEGLFWYIDPTPSLPFEIAGNDSASFLVYVNIIVNAPLLIDGYYIDILDINSSAGDYSAVIAIDSALIVHVGSWNELTNKVRVFPNPFRDNLNFEFYTEKPNFAELTIYDPLGSLILNSGRVLFNAAKNNFEWNGRKTNNTAAPDGLYFYRLICGDKVMTGQIVKLK